MSEQDYASTDLKRRPFHTTMVLISLISVIATTTFLFLYSNVLLDVTGILTSTAMNSVLGVFFEAFIWAVLILVLVLGVTVTASTISMEIISRRKDIGLMKSIGTLIDTIFDHFMAQAMILLVASLIVGIALGVVMYTLGLLWLASVIPEATFTFQFPFLQIGFAVVLYLIAGYYSAQKPIYELVQESPSVALNPDLGMKVRRAGFLDGLGLSFRLATKATGRRVRGTRRTMLSLFLSIALASILWTGGGIVETTVDAYVLRSMGDNVVAIGSPELLEQYYNAYSLTGTPLNDSFSYLETTDMVSNDLITEMESLPGVVNIESRLLDYATFSENPAIIWNPELEQYERIGGDRTSSTLVVGIDWDTTVSDWYFEGEETDTATQVWIGGQMANEYFEDPLIQSVGIQGQSLEIKAVTFDLLNGGNVAFIPLSLMQDYWEIDGTNLILIQLAEYSDNIISQIESLAAGYNLDIFLQNDVLEHNLGTIQIFWSLLEPLPLIALLSAFLSLMNYVLVSVFGRFRDYVIMRSVGAKPSFIAKTMIAEGIEIGLGSGIPAIFAATIFSVYFLVPEAAVPTFAYLPISMAAMLVSLLVVVVFAAIPVYLIFNSRTDLRVSEFSV